MAMGMSALQETPRRSAASSRARVRRLLRSPSALAVIAGLIVLGVATVGWMASHYNFGYFTRDPDALTNQAPYMGMVSFVGLFGWSAAATMLVCGGYLASLRGAIERRNALFVAAAALGYLMLDDAFQFHEYVYPHYLGVSDNAVQAVYILVTTALVVSGRRFLRSTNLRLLVTAGLLFAVSIGFDALVSREQTIAIEDGAKLIGIFMLVAYAADTALAESRLTFGELRSRSESAAA